MNAFGQPAFRASSAGLASATVLVLLVSTVFDGEPAGQSQSRIDRARRPAAAEGALLRVPRANEGE
jgi:hypothetical protein